MDRLPATTAAVLPEAAIQFRHGAHHRKVGGALNTATDLLASSPRPPATAVRHPRPADHATGSHRVPWHRTRSDSSRSQISAVLPIRPPAVPRPNRPR